MRDEGGCVTQAEVDVNVDVAMNVASFLPPCTAPGAATNFALKQGQCKRVQCAIANNHDHFAYVAGIRSWHAALMLGCRALRMLTEATKVGKHYF